jgi:hypothetical protein
MHILSQGSAGMIDIGRHVEKEVLDGLMKGDLAATAT